MSQVDVILPTESTGEMPVVRSINPLDLAEVLRDLTRLRSTKALSLSERHLLETSRARLVHELAAARGETADAIEKQLDRIIGVGRG